MKNADYRKNNDRTQNSSTYHKKDGTPIRNILKNDAKKEIDEHIAQIGFGVSDDDLTFMDMYKQWDELNGKSKK